MQLSNLVKIEGIDIEFFQIPDDCAATHRWGDQTFTVFELLYGANAATDNKEKGVQKIIENLKSNILCVIHKSKSKHIKVGYRGTGITETIIDQITDQEGMDKPIFLHGTFSISAIAPPTVSVFHLSDHYEIEECN